MVLQGFAFSGIAFGVAFVVAFVVAVIIKIVAVAVQRRSAPKQSSK